MEYAAYLMELFDTCDYATLQKEIKANPQIVLDLEIDLGEPYSPRVRTLYMLFTMMEDAPEWSVTKFLCDLADELKFPEGFTKQQYLRGLLETMSPFFRHWSYAQDIAVNVYNGDVERTSYVVSKLGPEIWEEKFYLHNNAPLYGHVRDEQMLDLLIATHPKKELILLEKVVLATVLGFVSNEYFLRFLEIPEIRTRLRDYRNDRSLICCARKIIDIFIAEELKLLEYFPIDNSLVGVVGRILEVESHKRYL